MPQPIFPAFTEWRASSDQAAAPRQRCRAGTPWRVRCPRQEVISEALGVPFACLYHETKCEDHEWPFPPGVLSGNDRWGSGLGETRWNPDLLNTKVKGGAWVQKPNGRSMVPWKSKCLGSKQICLQIPVPLQEFQQCPCLFWASVFLIGKWG